MASPSRKRQAALRLCPQHYLKEVQGDFPTPSPDGQYAYQQALLAENFALAEYQRVLRIYTDLLLEGKVPDDVEWHRHKAAGAE